MPTTDTFTPTTLPGVIYVGRTEGEMTIVLGKVGQVENPTFLADRVVSYRVADRVFHFVLEAAFAVDLPPHVAIKDVEGWVHGTLEGEGLLRIGENFAAPEASMVFLARMTEAAIAKLGYTYVALDIDALRTRARELNTKTWEKLRKKPKGKKSGASVYQEWLDRKAEPFQGILALTRPRDYLRSVLALGYMIKDLATGIGLEQVEVPLLRGGALKIFPSSLPSALLEAKAEADLNLMTTTSFSVRPSTLEEIPFSPNAMTVLLGQNLEKLEIPNTFLLPTKERPEEMRISPDYLASLGLLGGSYGEHCGYEGLGVRAIVPLEVYALLRDYPKDLPFVRFWLSLMFCRELGIRVQDFELPCCFAHCWGDLSNAAMLLDMAGHPVPASVQAWVAHVWVPAPTAVNAQEEDGETI